jgi:CubicO group peptidase (beta-lactamase class C family)
MFIRLILILSVSFISLTPGFGEHYWPTNKWKSATPQSVGVNPDSIDNLFQFIKKKQFPIDSVVIVKSGVLIGELYQNGTNEKSLSNIYSVTKSFTSALIGIAIDEGHIKNDKQKLESIFDKGFFKSKDQTLKNIKLKHLLTMTSGLKTRDNHLSNYAGVLALQNSKNWIDHIFSLGTESKSGEFYNYSNGGSHILAAILTKMTKTPLEEYAERRLFSYIGIKNYKWEKDPQGINHGYSNLELSARDMARLGLLYLNNGLWKDKQVISSSWIKKSLQPHSEPNKGRFNPFRLYPYNGYGYQWWNSDTAWKADMGYRKAWGLGQETKNQQEYFFALGYEGQYVFILPQDNIVAVFKSRFKKASDILIPKALVEEFIIN